MLGEDPLIPPFVSSLEEKLKKGEVSLEDFLLDNSAVIAFRTGSKTVIQYVRSHLREILHYACDYDMDNMKMCAFVLLCSQKQQSVMEEVLENPIFTEMAYNQLINSSTPDIIGRLASLTTNFLLSAPKTAIKSFGIFILEFLKYVGNYSVETMFESLLSTDPRASDAEKWLIDIGIVDKIAEILSNIDIDYKSDNPYSDEYILQINGLYNIIISVGSNIQCVQSFCNPKLIDSLSIKMKNAPSFLEGGRWGALKVLICKQSAEMMELFCVDAMALLMSATSAATCDVVNSISFLTKMIVMRPSIRNELLRGQILQIMLRIAYQFAKSSILINVFIDFVKTAFVCEEFRPRILQSYIPMFMYEIGQKQYREFVAAASKCMIIIRKKAKHDKRLYKELKAVELYTDFEQRFLLPYKSRMKHKYGGEVFVNIAMTY